MRLGAHTSAAGGIARAIDRAHAIGAECAQIFLGAPQQWRSAHFEDADLAEFRDLAATLNVGPNVVHAPYLVNLASADATLRERSTQALIEQIRWCDQLGILGLVVHVGSARDAASHELALDLVAEAIAAVLNASTTAHFLIENTAGMGASIGSRFGDIGALLSRLGAHPRVGVCLDTAHTLEAGYDIRTAAGVDAVLTAFAYEVGLDRLAALHVNDSKTAFASHVDRHENLGAGHLGESGLAAFLTDPRVAELPFFLEVPGEKGKGPDRTSIDTLRRLAGQPTLEPAAAADAPAAPVPPARARPPRRSSPDSPARSTSD